MRPDTPVDFQGLAYFNTFESVADFFFEAAGFFVSGRDR
jgi:hypothetical protein